MRIKLDENMPASLVAELTRGGHDVDTVLSEGLQGHVDADVWSAAQRESRLLITQDLDFSDVRRFKPGAHAGLLLIRLAKPGRAALHEAVLRVLAAGGLETWHSCFVVATEHKLRVRRPGP